MDIDAVAFDLDGTLYPRAMMYRLSAPLAFRYPRFLYHFACVRRTLRRLGEMDDFRRTQASLLATRLGCALRRAEALIERIVYREWIDLLRGIRPFPAVRWALGRLKASGLRLGVLSDFPVDEKLRYLGLEGLWDASLCSEEAGYLKPHPAPFHRLAERLGLPCARILYVGDSAAYDIRGAMGVGMRTAHVGWPPARVADLRFRSYDELPSLVER